VCAASRGTSSALCGGGGWRPSSVRATTAFHRTRPVLAPRLGEHAQLVALEEPALSEAPREGELDDVAIVAVHPPGLGADDRPRERVARDVVRQEALEPDDAPRVAHRARERFLREPLAQSVRVPADRLLRADEQEVVGLAGEGLDASEDAAQRGVDRAHRLRVHLVRLEPLDEDAAGLEAVPDGLVEVLREEARDPGAVRVARLREDEIVLAARGQQELARVADRDVDPGVRQNAAVDRGAVARHAEHRRLELGDVDALDRRQRPEPAGRRAGAETDDERVLDAGMERGAHHPAHDLSGRVLSRVPVDLAVDDERRAAARLEEGHGALAPVGVPGDQAALVSLPHDHVVGRGGLEVDPARADRAVAPDRGRPGRKEHRDARRDARERQPGAGTAGG
jgi:hypothetical protein